LFESLGITSTTLQIYTTLLEQPDLKAEELAIKAGCSPEQVETSLGELRELKLLIPRWTGGAEYAVHPNLGFSLLSQRRRQQIDQLTEELHADELRAELITQQYSESMRNRDQREIEIVEGADRAHQRIGEFRLTKSFWVLNNFSQTNPEFGDPEDSPDKPVLDANIEIRAVYVAALFNNKRVLDYFRWMHERGAKIRTSPIVPMRLMIYDGTAAVTALDPDDHSAGLVVYHSKSALVMAKALFERYWHQAEDPFSDQPGPKIELLPQELELLNLLVEGATDEQAGRKLGVSLRTVRRMAAKLSEQAGASGRFELGVRAAQRGWVR
jgi:DNA-binding CsgD family transcriptional regulator